MKQNLWSFLTEQFLLFIVLAGLHRKLARLRNTIIQPIGCNETAFKLPIHPVFAHTLICVTIVSALLSFPNKDGRL